MEEIPLCSEDVRPLLRSKGQKDLERPGMPGPVRREPSILRGQMAAQVQVTHSSLFCHQASPDPSQKSQVHQIFVR